MDIRDTNLKFSGELSDLNNPKMIVQHHPAHPSWNHIDVHLYHRDSLGWFGGGYNYFINIDGTIYKIRGENQGAHARNYNSKSIGIAYQGHFGYQKMTDEQLESGIKLNVHLMKKYGIDKNSIKQNILGHRDVGATACPEKNFREKELKDGIEKMINTEGDSVDIKESPNLEDNYHKISKGDTLWSISKEYGVSVDKLKELNPSIDPNSMSVGDEIVLIQENVNDKVKKYKIKSGDTFWKIGNEFDVSVDVLLEMNPDTEPSQLKIGQNILIPEGIEVIENKQGKVLSNSEKWVGYVKPYKLNVRDKANMDGKVIKTISKGNEVKVYDQIGNWLCIDIKNNHYVHKNHIQETKVSEPNNNQSDSMPVLRVGDRGRNVRKLQRTLNSVYFKVGEVDGVFGRKTKDAVERFQSMYAPPIDGVVGRKTWNALDRVSK